MGQLGAGPPGNGCGEAEVPSGFRTRMPMFVIPAQTTNDRRNERLRIVKVLCKKRERGYGFVVWLEPANSL